MDHKEEEPNMNSSSYARDHMANERTFLAWIRTSIGIMAFGFVVEKFALFLKHITLFLGHSNPQLLQEGSHLFQGYSATLGLFLVALGTLLCLLAFINYKTVEKQLKKAQYEPSILLNVMLTLSIMLIGVFLMVYLSSNL